MMRSFFRIIMHLATNKRLFKLFFSKDSIIQIEIRKKRTSILQSWSVNGYTTQLEHPSIHPFSIPAWSNLGLWGGWSLSQLCHWARGGVPPGRVTSPSQGHTETNETHNHAHSLHFFGRSEEAGVPRQSSRIHKTQKGPSRESNQEPFCCEAKMLTTTPVSSQSWNMKNIVFNKWHLCFKESKQTKKARWAETKC